MESETAIDKLLATPVAAINLGVEDFADNLESQGSCTLTGPRQPVATQR